MDPLAMYSSRILFVSEESINGWIMMVGLSHNVNMLNTDIKKSLISWHLHSTVVQKDINT